MPKTRAELEAQFKQLMADAAEAANADAAAAEASGNPYMKFLLPSAVTSHQPEEPLYDTAAVKKISEDGMAALNDGDFMKFIGGVVDFAIARLPGV